MTMDNLFEAYYNLYRSEAEIPASTDDEYPVAMRLFNEAINRWEHYDNTLWNELWQTAQREGDGELNIVVGQTEYATPGNFKNAGGSITLRDDNGKMMQRYPIVASEDAQFMADTATYAYFTGSPIGGYVLNLNPAPNDTLDGYNIDYLYYKTATRFELGTDVTEMSDPYFIVHRALANRFRSSRNPYYSSALRDAEDAMRMMQLTNNSGSWGNPWSVPDRSNTQFGW